MSNYPYAEIDYRAIERKAQRMRAEAARDLGRAFTAWLRTVLHLRPRHA